ncbi:gamma-carotene 1'-hydroxylase CruF [Oscillatoria salina]|uniref:gamma-carotene 1'-hydroxylase CruF n=1 Tax=Oscillatoria salina TaxID=331517 RepID=UPI0013BB7829|nr:carotenoid biosynthesis protein [Oscillatoria salina]MBZ8182896.1 carotenoid biosynthesis protein [Oscillatoria salina IIICB1]NET88937.1 carotenoid biosynthesis protein [Kamptonema sp. SIO1D9]
MKRLVITERACLIGHVLSLVFGWAGLLIVLPNPDLIASLPAIGEKAFAWSMAGGGVVYMLLGTATVAIYAYRTLGLWHWLTFMLPAVFISLGSELSGTSTGFPFGHYSYLSGLGYKIGGLVPFTIPLSWFYVGFSGYVIARAGLERWLKPSWLRDVSAIATGSLLLTVWDFVLDPAMSQMSVPFWVWHQPGAFFGMPYQNFVGWFATGCVFMTVATLFWKKFPTHLPSKQLGLPLAVYLSNIAFGAVLSLAGGFWIPVILGVSLSIVPAFILYRTANSTQISDLEKLAEIQQAKEKTAQVPVASVGVMPK